MIAIGIKAKRQEYVTTKKTAKAMGSGDLDVYATPAMVAFMEFTAKNSIASYLEAGEGSVGVRMDVQHLSATPVGLAVDCESELIAIDGRKLTFEIKVLDNAGVVGSAIHERFIVDNERFLKKAYTKLEDIH